MIRMHTLLGLLNGDLDRKNRRNNIDKQTKLMVAMHTKKILLLLQNFSSLSISEFFHQLFGIKKVAYLIKNQITFKIAIIQLFKI